MDFDFKDFGKNIFDESIMKEKLPSPVFAEWKSAVSSENELDKVTADAIAHAMKEWALSKGCTHYTHWFHPLTGLTAEKHEAFIDKRNGLPITKFSGKELIKGEPDASSFPSGGLRSTFEARGYSYWDYSSPAFIRDNILYIPSVFVSYNGESLDTKKPLLQSNEAISKAATRICNVFGDKDVTSVIPSIGLEQEYFIVDREHFLKRRDLYLTGRTLLGTLPPKGQQLEEHYFGSIPHRVKKFMDDVDKELWELGIYAKSEHNEVAPGQFEIVPLFANANVSIDQNMILMDVLKKVALKHDLVCLLAEKPFKGVNGSGKHNNYSLTTNNGINLLDPGKNAHDNVRFLVFVSALIEAVDTYPELIRLACSCPCNDFRLGANEAPPAIVSMFLSETVENLLYQLIDGKPLSYEKSSLNEFGMLSIASLPRDTADRNRTSPIAFTGNKFEFRMLGSSLNPSELNTVINTTLAKSLTRIADELEGHKYRQDVREASIKICAEIMKKHNKVLFNGDGYSSSWVEEAARRGLPNIKTYVESIPYLVDDKSRELFTSLNVYSDKELFAREEIKYQGFLDIRLIEYRTIMSMIHQETIPSAIKEINFITTSSSYMPSSVLKKAKALGDFIDEITELVNRLEKELKIALSNPTNKEKCFALIKNVRPIEEELRERCDHMEGYISKEHLPYPNYEDLFFKIDY